MQTEMTGKTASVRYSGVRSGILQWLLVALVVTVFHGTALAGWTETESGGQWFTVTRIWMDHNPTIMKIVINGNVGNCGSTFVLDKSWGGGFPDPQYQAMYSIALTSMTVGVELNILYNWDNNQCYINQLEVRRAGGSNKGERVKDYPLPPQTRRA